MSGIVLYAQLRLQGHLPLNPDGMKAVPPGLSFNTAVSFLTNTNWQNYSGESTMSHLTQMAGLAVHNFVSAAAGAAVAVALIRGLVAGGARRPSATSGSTWSAPTTRVLLPLSFVVALVLVSQGVVQNFHAARTVTTVEGATQSIPGGPVASQEAIKDLGQNGGGPYNANAAHPFENPNPITNLLILWSILAIPFALTVHLRANGEGPQAGLGRLRRHVRPLADRRADRHVRWRLTAAATWRARRSASERRRCGLFADTTTGTSTGSINCQHDSMTPLGGAVPLVNMMLGEVSPGGTGSGLYGMLVFALTSVFIAGLMVGRTPEYLGKKIQAVEMKLVVLYLLAVPIAILSFAGASVLLKTALSSLANGGPHGLSEMTYAFVSASNNNGSAFGGLTGNTQWFNTTLGLCMLVGRFLLMVPVLAIAGSLARKQPVPPSAGTFPTGTPLFAGLLTAVVVIVVGLTYFPVVALGPVVEHLAGKF